MINKSFNHDIYEEIGVKRIDKFKNDGIHFQVINKEKLIYAMMKYNFTLHDEKNWEDINWPTNKNPYDGSTLDSFLKEEQSKKAYLETSKGRRVYLDEKPNKSS